MHSFLLVPLILLFIVVLGVMYHNMVDDDNAVAIFSFMFGSVGLFVSLLVAGNNWNIKQWPVEYNTESVTSKIFVHTKYGDFESDKKIDFDNWSKNLPGYIIQNCNAFGGINNSYFTTEPVVEK